MKRLKTNECFFAIITILILTSCNESSSISEKLDKDTSAVVATNASNETDITPPYDPAMDPYLTGGDAIKKFGDTLGVKFYEVSAKPGVTFPLHAHPDHTVYVLEGGTVAIYLNPPGSYDTLTFPTGTALISGPLADSGINVGKTTIKFLVTDIYRPRNK